MTNRDGQHSAQYKLQQGSSSSPSVLSTIQFPIQPNSSSLSNGGDGASRYRHVLTSKAISPQMDLVAIISRDVATGSSSSATDAASLLPPPPPGMSAVANQARMRMLMMARARALAAGGKGGATTTALEAPKVSKCPSLRLSLWRMASMTGEQGSRVWDVEIKVPDHFEELGKEVKEDESMEVCAMSWSPDCRSIALTVEVTRSKRDQGGGIANSMSRRKRYLMLYAMQDGKLERLVIVPDQLQEQAQPSQLFGLIWKQLSSNRQIRSIPGSAEYILKRMEALPEIANLLEEKEAKNKQRQRAMNAMRGGSQKQQAVDLKIDEIMQNKTDGESINLLKHPYSKKGVHTNRAEGMDVITASLNIICVYDAREVHLFLEANIYLGSIYVDDTIQAVDLHPFTKDLLLTCGRVQDSSIRCQILTTALNSANDRYSSVLYLVSLSTMSYHLLTYAHDALVDVRNLYRSTHINCITPWIQKGKIIERKYSTHFSSEMQMLLLTSTANEAITSILVGNETMTEGDLSKLRAEVASAWNKMEVLIDAILQAMQRMSIVWNEVKGCCSWRERYGDFLKEEDAVAITKVLSLISQMQKQCFALLRHAQQESKCWNHFYRWFKFERTRQEALRDQVPEPKSDVAFDVLLIADFLKRGFVNYAFEGAIGIVLDKKTRGTFVEDEDEELQEDSVIEQAGESLEVESGDGIGAESIVAQGRNLHKQSKETLEEVMMARLKELQEPPKLAVLKKKSAPSPQDVSQMRRCPYILTGSIAGLSTRQTNPTKAVVDMMKGLKEMLKISSNLFSKAISRFAIQQEPRHYLEMEPGTSLSALRSDALRSTSEAMDKGENGDRIIRSLFDEESSRHYLLGSRGTPEGNSHLIIIITDRTNAMTQKVEIECQGQVVDVNFYSREEVIVLLFDGQKTSFASFRFDETTFNTSSGGTIMAQRCYNLQQGDESQRPTQLALNHAKEVAATLDEQGRLVYYDLVHLEQGVDVDEDMG